MTLKRWPFGGKKTGWQSSLAWFLAVVIIISSFAVRLYRIEYPLADWHSFRQVDTAAVTREFVRRGIDVLHPRYHDISNIQSGQLNPDGWRMVEFPLLNALTAFLLRTWPELPLVATSRMVSVVASTISLVCLMYVGYRLHGWTTALIAGAVFGWMPYNIYFSRTVLPEPFLVMWVLLSAVAMLEWSRRYPRSPKTAFVRADAWLLVAGASMAVALLVKPMAVFSVPFLIGIAWRYRQWRFQPWVKALLIGGLSTLPLLWWREWIQQFPTGIPASDWLLNGNGIRLRPAWWRWLFADRLGRLMFGYWGTPFVLLGLVVGAENWSVSKRWSQTFASVLRGLDSWLQNNGAVVLGMFGVLVYFVVFATGNVQHDYYQIPTVPVLALAWARGVVWVWEKTKGSGQQWIATGVLAGIIGLSWMFSWYEIRGNFNVNNWVIVQAGEAVQRHAAPDDLVIANYSGDTTLLFYTQRWGWPIGFSIDEKIADGADIYVSTALDDEANALMKQYTVLEKSAEYVVIDLGQPRGVVEDEPSESQP